uniref:Uncharacterized protein n=1 Tax=Oryza glumipatula TaxID=40148 RepID=A0A0D9ZJ73_9ORYZ
MEFHVKGTILRSKGGICQTIKIAQINVWFNEFDSSDNSIRMEHGIHEEGTSTLSCVALAAPPPPPWSPRDPMAAAGETTTRGAFSAGRWCCEESGAEMDLGKIGWSLDDDDRAQRRDHARNGQKGFKSDQNTRDLNGFEKGGTGCFEFSHRERVEQREEERKEDERGGGGLESQNN